MRKRRRRAEPVAGRLHRAEGARGLPRSPRRVRRHQPASGSRSCATSFKAEHDDYNAIMAEALADRLAEAFAECLHKRVRDEWGFGRDENLSPRRAHRGKVPRHPPGRRLSGVPGSHREGHALAAARRREEHRHALTEIVRHVAGLQRERALLRAPRGALLRPRQDRPRSGRRLRRRKGMTRPRSSAGSARTSATPSGASPLALRVSLCLAGLRPLRFASLPVARLGPA